MGQERPKYHVTDDGKVFFVNADGTTTKYGRIVPEMEEARRPRKPIPCFVWWIVAILLLVGGAYCGTFRYKIAWIIEYQDRYRTGSIVDSLESLSWFCIGLLLLTLILFVCVIRLNNKMRVNK